MTGRAASAIVGAALAVGCLAGSGESGSAAGAAQSVRLAAADGSASAPFQPSVAVSVRPAGNGAWVVRGGDFGALIDSREVVKTPSAVTLAEWIVAALMAGGALILAACVALVWLVLVVMYGIWQLVAGPSSRRSNRERN